MSSNAPPTPCPICKKVLDAATCMEGEHKPSPGDVSICLYCQTWLRFTDDLGLRLFIEDDFKDFTKEQVKLLKDASKMAYEAMKGRGLK